MGGSSASRGIAYLKLIDVLEEREFAVERAASLVDVVELSFKDAEVGVVRVVVLDGLFIESDEFRRRIYAVLVVEKIHDVGIVLLCRGGLAGLKQSLHIVQVDPVGTLLHVERFAADRHELDIILVTVQDIDGVMDYPQVKRMIIIGYRRYPAVAARTVQKIALVQLYGFEVKVGLFLFGLGGHALFV